MDFLVDINPDLELPEYDLVLCKLSEEPITSLNNITGLEYSPRFIDISELSFNIYKYRMESNGEEVENEIYELVKGDFLILMNDNKYFYIDSAKEVADDSGKTYKQVHCYSREYQFSQKRLSGYIGISKVIYDPLDRVGEDDLDNGVMNYVEKITSWKIGYVNSNVLLKHRELNFVNVNLLQAFQEIQKSFGCVFVYNTVDKIIDIYEVEQLGTNQGLYISDSNFLKSIEKSINSDEIKTRLYLYGKDNVSIQSVNVTGKPYIDNYDYYKTTEYMSQDLIDALNNYEDFIDTKRGLFNGYLISLNEKTSQLGTKNDEMIALNTELKAIQSDLDIAISENEDLIDLQTQLSSKLAVIDIKQGEIDVLKSDISIINEDIESIGEDIDTSMHFTENQLDELDSFIKEDVFNDGNYTEDNINELFVEGTKILTKLSNPAIHFNANAVSFLDVVECQHIWDKFVLGDIVRLYHKRLGFDYEVRLVGYTHQPDNNSLDLKFSNTDSVDDSTLYLSELLDDLKTTSVNVDFNKYRWDKGDEANSTINRYINSNLDLTKQQVMGASDQKPIFDDRGFWAFKEVDNIISPEQTRIVNNAIVMTEDNWATVDIAISPKLGVNANLINGKIGNLATINAHQITIENGQTIPDEVLGGSIVKQNTDYNGIIINSEDGFVATKSDGKVKTIVNATTGFKIQNKKINEWNDVISFDTEGNLTMEGHIRANGGYFKGDISGSTGTFSGIVNASDYRIGGVSILNNGLIKGDNIESITTNQLIAGDVKISTALIDELVVGDNVAMGANATISWGKVTGQPTILNSTDVTTITNNTISTTNVVAQNLQVKGANISGSLIGAYIDGGTITGSEVWASFIKLVDELNYDSSAVYMDWSGIYSESSSGNLDGVSIFTSDDHKALDFYSVGSLVGTTYYNTGDNRLWFGSWGKGLKIFAGGNDRNSPYLENMSITASTIYMEGTVNFTNANISGLTVSFA